MSTMLGSLRRLVLAPTLLSVTFAERGFPVTADAATVQRLEAIPQSVVCGFEWGIDTSGLRELERRIAMIEPELRGFAYEGATMAAVVRDAMSGFRTRRTRDLLTGPALPHLLLCYIGIGFAMARLPRRLWRAVLPEIPDNGFHPTMSWLAVDGYAFDRAYFDTRRWVDEQYVPPTYPWLGRPDYFPRAVDQGVGRALWFVHGGDTDAVSAGVARFAPHRHADLWSGVGLAATNAGGAPEEGLREMRDAAGEHWRELALGAVFAATARVIADDVPAHTAAATQALADLTVEAAVIIGARTAATESDATDACPAYEVWRARIRDEFPAPGLRRTG